MQKNAEVKPKKQSMVNLDINEYTYLQRQGQYIETFGGNKDMRFYQQAT